MAIPNIPAGSSGLAQRTILNQGSIDTWKAMQTHEATAFTSTGSAPTFVLTPSPALASYAANQSFRVKFHAAGTAPTLNVSGQGAKNVKVYDARGNKIAAVVYANQLAVCEYDGTDFVILNPPQPKNAGPMVNYKASCSGLSALIPMTADLLTVRDANGGYIELAGVSLSLNTAGTGANGLDTGTLAASTWYYKFVVYNPTTGATAALASLSSTSPTLPSGYTHFKRVGAFRTDGSVNKYPLSMTWAGARARYKVAAGSNLTAYPTMASGIVGTITAVSVANFIPSTAPEIAIQVGVPGIATAGIALYSNSAAASLLVNQVGLSGSANYSITNVQLESGNVYWQSTISASCYLFAYGWTDAL